MKKLVIAFCLVLSGFVYGQQDYWYIEDSLVPYMTEYIVDSEGRDIYSKSYLIGKVDYVFYADLGFNGESIILGAAGKNNRGIYISSYLEGNYEMTRLVLYHELGHLIKQSGYHSCVECYDIMSSGAPLDLSPFSDDLFWDSKVDDYFEWIDND